MNKEEIANKMEKLAKGFRFGAITIYEKEELIKKLDHDFEQFKKEFLAKLEEEDKKPFEVELPEDGEVVYFIDLKNGDVFSKYFNVYNMSDIKHFENGLYFETREEAEQHLKEQRLIFKIKKWAKIHNEGWEPDWSDWDINKFIICYDGRDEGLEIDVWGNTSHISVLPAFKTRGIAQACIDEFGEEIREVFC